MNIIELSIHSQEDTVTAIEQYFGNILLDDDLAGNSDSSQSMMVGVAVSVLN